MRHDKLIAEFERQAAILCVITNGIMSSKREGRLAAYLMAESYMALVKDHSKELIEFFQGQQIKVYEWLDQHFAPLEFLGEPDYGDLLISIQRGLGKERYIKEGTRPFMREASRDSKAVPRKHEPLAVQVEKLKGLVKELRDDLREMTRDCIVERKGRLVAEAKVEKMQALVT